MHLRRVITTILVGGVCWHAAGVGAQQEETPGEPPTFRADINFVRVDVIVTDRDGDPVSDLTADDFQVFEDGIPQSIEQFTLVKVDGNLQPGDEPLRDLRTVDDQIREAGRSDVRLFVIFFDDYHTRPISALSVKRALTDFVQRLGPKDLVGIMYPLTPLDAISFTRRQESLLSAIDNFEGRKYRYEPRNTFEQEYFDYPTEQVERIRNEVVMSALRGLSIRLGALREGRKAVLFVSEGLASSLPPEMRFANAQSQFPGSARPDGPNEAAYSFFSQAELLRDFSEVFDAANRNNTAFYPIDPRGLAVSEFHIDEVASPAADRQILRESQETLRALADETDGRAIVGRNDLAGGLAQMVQDSSAYYLLGYSSSQAPDDGRFHEIDVRLSERVRARRLEVRTRKGYMAPTTEDVRRAERPSTPVASRAVQQALESMAQPRASGRLVHSWVGLSRGAEGKTRVTYVWEPVADSADQRGEAAGAVSLLAASVDGDLLFRGTSASSESVVAFEVPPGAIELRIAVESASGGVLDRDTQEIVVPDLSARDAPLMSTPRVYRARTAREIRTLATDADARPRVGRDFSRTERALIRFDLYGDDAVAALLNRTGEKISDLPVSLAEAGGTHQIELPLAALAPSEYLIEITATAGAAENRVLVPLKVGP